MPDMASERERREERWCEGGGVGGRERGVGERRGEWGEEGRRGRGEGRVIIFLTCRWCCGMGTGPQ